MKKNSFWNGFKTYAVWAFAITGLAFTIKWAVSYFKKKQTPPPPATK